MNSLLVINSSVTPDSVSRLLVEDAVAALVEAHPEARVVRRDLGRQPVPHLTVDTLGGLFDPKTEEERRTRALSDELLAELRAADTIVVGAPMYNFGVATPLRAWFDHVLRAGETFKYTESGAIGLLTGKRVVVIESRGGFYSEGPDAAIDFQEPYLRHLFGFMGITDVAFIRAEKIAYGPEAREASVTQARARIVALGGPPRAVAA